LQFRRVLFRSQIAEWMPLVMQQRRLNQPIAATRVEYGSDVDFGSLTRNMVRHLTSLDNFQLHLSHSVKSLRKSKSGRWRVTVRDEQSGEDKVFKARFVFLGAGGGALPLLQKSDRKSTRLNSSHVKIS